MRCCDLLDARSLDKSLVVVAEQRRRRRATGCWRRCASTRSSGWRRAGRRDAVARRHAEYFLALAERPSRSCVGRAGGGVARAARSGARQPAGGARVVARARRGRLFAPGRGAPHVLGPARAPDGRAAVAGGGARSEAAKAPVLGAGEGARGAGHLALQQGDLAAARAYFEERLRIAGSWAICGRSPGRIRLGCGSPVARRPCGPRARTWKRVSRAAGQLGHDRMIADRSRSGRAGAPGGRMGGGAPALRASLGSLPAVRSSGMA